MNLNTDPTKDALKALIANCNADYQKGERAVIWANANGDVTISTINVHGIINPLVINPVFSYTAEPQFDGYIMTYETGNHDAHIGDMYSTIMDTWHQYRKDKPPRD